VVIRERYKAVGNSIDALTNSLNFALTRIGDRLVNLEIGVPMTEANKCVAHSSNEYGQAFDCTARRSFDTPGIQLLSLGGNQTCLF